MPFTHRHIFRYEITQSDNDEFPVSTLTSEVEGDATLTGMLESFRAHLQGCGYIVDGALAIVPEPTYEVAVPKKVVKYQIATKLMHRSIKIIKNY